MSDSPSLLSLPEEVLRHIGDFLTPQSLLALCATCRFIRSALNDNSVWRKYSHGGLVSRGLQKIPSVVSPTFTEPEHETSTLEPLCDHRLHFLRQSRLVNNYSKAKFVKHSVPFNNFLSDFETTSFFSNRQITYKDLYLFSLGYSDGYDEEVTVFKIVEAPTLLVTFKLLKHLSDPDYCVIIFLQVVGDKLVIRQDNWFDVYDIRLPDLKFPLCHTIDVSLFHTVDFSRAIIIDSFIFVENCFSPNSNNNTVHVWDINSGTRLLDINPKIEGSDLKVCNFSTDQKCVLLCEEVLLASTPFITPHLLVYSLVTFHYTDFQVVLPYKLVPTNPTRYIALINNHHVVMIDNRKPNVSDIYVFDIKTTKLIGIKQVDSSSKIESFIVDDSLLLTNSSSVKMVNLSNLETFIVMEFGSSQILLEDFPSICCINLLSLHNLLIVTFSSNTEVWELKNRKKCITLGCIQFISVSGYCSKLILLNEGTLEILTFW